MSQTGNSKQWRTYYESKRHKGLEAAHSKGRKNLKIYNRFSLKLQATINKYN